MSYAGPDVDPAVMGVSFKFGSTRVVPIVHMSFLGVSLRYVENLELKEPWVESHELVLQPETQVHDL